MNPVTTRRIAIAAVLVLTRLASWGLLDATPDGAQEARRWLDGALDLVLFAVETWVRRQALALRPSHPCPGDEREQGNEDEKATAVGKKAELLRSIREAPRGAGSPARADRETPRS
jgi:hypothetical protein